ncbi:MAG: tetratricopeptide repeat protein [Polyangia bacterium]
MIAQRTVRPWFNRHLFLGAAAWLLFTLPAGTVAAAGVNQDAVAKVVRLNKEARQFYDAMEFTLAEKSLKKALEIGEAASLGDHVVMAGTHGNLGVLYATGIKNEDQALFHFKKALELRPEYVPSKEMSSPEVKDLFQRARSEMETSATPSVPDTTGPAVASQGQLRCPAAEVARAGSSLKLRCVADGPLTAAEVMVYFRAGRGSAFKSRKMSAESTLDGSLSWATQLPPEATSADQLFLYFEALDRQGEVVSSVGSTDSPTVVGIRSSGTVAASSGGGSETDVGGEGESTREESGFWWLGLGLGSGYGYAGKSGPEGWGKHVQDYVPGRAPAPLGQVTPEVGYFLTPSLSLSVQGRLQYLPRTSSRTADGAIAFLARLLYFTSGETVRFYGGAVLGGGNGFRLQVSGLHTDETGNNTVSDTVRGGPVVFGVGGGLSVSLSDSWSWILETNILGGAPDFSMVVDLNTGVRYRL